MAARKARPGARTSNRPLASGRGALAQLLALTVAELEAAGAHYALVGGVAVGLLAEPRVTRDLDFAISVPDDREAERLLLGLQRRGFVVQTLFENDQKRISTVRTLYRRGPRVFIDFLFHNARIEQELVAAASPFRIAGVDGVQVVGRTHLLAMKLLASRPKDLPDLQHLLEAASPTELKAVTPVLTLMTQRGAAKGRNLLAEWKSLVRRVRAVPPHERESGARLRHLFGPSPRK